MKFGLIICSQHKIQLIKLNLNCKVNLMAQIMSFKRDLMIYKIHKIVY